MDTTGNMGGRITKTNHIGSSVWVQIFTGKDPNTV